MYKKSKSTEKIHGKKVKIGKGVGERVGKRARGAVETRKKRVADELKALMMD